MTSTTPVRSDDLGVPRRSSRTKSDAGEKPFDVMKWLRETRNWTYEDTRDMSLEEKRRWSEKRIRRHPFLAELHPRRKAPEGGKAPASATGGRGAAFQA